MGKQKFIPQQVLFALNQVKQKNKTAKQVCLELGITQATFSNWKKTHEIRKLREEVKALKSSMEVNMDNSQPDFDQEETNMLTMVSDIIVEIILKEIEEEEKKNDTENN